MKKLFILLILLPCVIFAQTGKHDTDSIFDTSITGTASDTSDWQHTRPTMTFWYFVNDSTAASDSVDIKFVVEFSNDYTDTSKYVLTDSITVTTDSTWASWIFTDEARPSAPYYRVRATGGSDNLKLYPVVVKFEEAHFYFRK